MVQQPERGFAKAETTVRLRSPAPFFGGVAHQQSARLTCERQRGQHSSLPPFSRGHSSASQSGCFTCIRSKARTLLPSPFLSLWCSPDNMPASHAGDHRSKAGQGYQLIALKALSAMHSLGKRISPVQFRVRAPVAQSSQRSSGFHKPAVSGAAPETATICRLCPARCRAALLLSHRAGAMLLRRALSAIRPDTAHPLPIL